MSVYFEAGNQPLQGKVAVANVIVNRRDSKSYPDSICGVVKQHKQFSYYGDDKPEKAPINDSKAEIKAWEDSYLIASSFLSEGSDGNHITDITNGALHYHADYVNPCWSNEKGGKWVGRHLFITEPTQC